MELTKDWGDMVVLASTSQETSSSVLNGLKRSYIIIPANHPIFGGTVPHFYQKFHVPLNRGNVAPFCANAETENSLNFGAESKCGALT